ncbi:hypothetical protein LEMLEM_LOCUS22813, partial [Lemmus lemmus]
MLGDPRNATGAETSVQGTSLLWILNFKRASITQRLENLF